MSTAAASLAQSDFTEGQIRIVHCHQQLSQRQLIKTHQSANCFATQIHERLRLAEQNRFALTLGPRDASREFSLVRPISFPLQRQRFNQQITGIVAGLRVFPTWIAQSHDEMH
jgi:hypothetical protein